MTLGDYVISLLLVSVVIRQMRGRHLTVYALLWPIALVLFFGAMNFKGIATGGSDIAFTITIGLIGAILGVLCGLLTKVFENRAGKVIGKATTAAVIVWIVGTCSRLAFALYATHGGGADIARFSRTFHVTGFEVWSNALLLMALAEVLGRTIVLAVRAWQFNTRGEASKPQIAE